MNRNRFLFTALAVLMLSLIGNGTTRLRSEDIHCEGYLKPLFMISVRRWVCFFTRR